MDDNPSQAAFVERAYRETFDLLVDVRDYVKNAPAAGSSGLESADKVQLSYELSRVTRQLTNVMAWLMLRKAVIAGEITEAEAAADPAAKMDTQPDDGAPEDPAAQARLPIAARGLFDRSRRLVDHVAALAGDKSRSGT